MIPLNSCTYCLRLFIFRRFSSIAVSARREEDVIRMLRDVVDPATNKPIESLGILQVQHVLLPNFYLLFPLHKILLFFFQSVKVNKENQLRVSLDFFVPGYPFRNEVKFGSITIQKAISYIYNASFE